MNPLSVSRIAQVSLWIAALLLVLAQFAFPRVSTGGGWCLPYFDAPLEMGYPSYQFTGYGFPIQFVTVAKQECFSQKSVSLEWFPPGILIDSVLPGIVLYVWYRLNRRYQKRNHGNVEEK